jgi:type VI secretion system secreted protein VgrG
MSKQASAVEHLASFHRFMQDTRLLRLTTPAGADLLAECVRGEEAISRGYTFKIDALSVDAHIPLKSLLGQPALLQLLTSSSYDALRPFHGHITAAEMTGANGGFARYVLTLEPWTRFLSLGRDSRIFQDMTVLDILDVVFRSYAGRGTLVPAWRFELADRSVYPKRSLTTQYQESDLAFVERLMHEEGLFYFFEHSGAPGSPSLGSHTLVIADHNGAFTPNAQDTVEFTQPGAVMKADSIDRWRTESRLSTNAIELGSWDYRTLRRRQASMAAVSSDAPQLTSRDAPGVYAWPGREQAERIARNQIEALEVQQQVHVAAGTVRTFAPGTTFTLHGHARFDELDHDDGRTFAIVRTVHLMHNNLSADVLSSVTKLLGKGAVALAAANEPGMRALHASGEDRPLYRNRIDAIAASRPYRSIGADEHGRLLHPRPTVRGQQTAIVVGPPGAAIYTDRDHRIKVQFHWQRGAASHSRATHPHPDSHTGAPGNDTAGTWVRVATPIAGANWGSNMLPRIGQEVLVDFLEGDIDRPVVIGSLYNGHGQPDAQHNQAAYGAGGVATGNAMPWFPGESAGNAHPAVLSGIKTQAMQASQEGTGAYSQLVFDDSPGQSRLVLQRHTKPHDGAAELNLGQLRHQSDNALLSAAGFGAELKTVQSAAVRAGQGLLLSSDARNGGSGNQLDSREAVAQIGDSLQLQTDLTTQAQKHNAKLKNESDPAELPAIKQMAHSVEVVSATDEGAQGRVAAYSAPHLQLSSPAGIVTSTPADVVLSAGTTGSIGAGQDINFAAQRSTSTLVVGGISLFTYGKASNKAKPNQEVGLKLHAASGKVSSQSQSGTTSLIADKTVTVASVNKTVSISAPKKHVLLTAQGAYIKLEGGNIEVHAPGKVEFRATMKELAGPVSASSADIAMKISEMNIKRDLEIEYVDADGNVLTDEPVTLKFSNAVEKTMTLNSAGKALIKSAPLGPFGAKQPRRR